MHIPGNDTKRTRIKANVICGRRLVRASLCLLVAFTSLAAPLPAVARNPVEALWAESRKDQHYVIPSREELDRAESLFLRTLGGKEGYPSLERAWTSLGFELVDIRSGQEPIWFLRERPGQKRGRGCYAFRANAIVALCLPCTKSGQLDIMFSLVGSG